MLNKFFFKTLITDEIFMGVKNLHLILIFLIKINF